MSLTNLARTTSTAPFRRAMNDIFESMERDMLAPWGLASQFPSAGSPFPSLFSSSMNLDFHETDTGFELIADLPGMKEEDITVDVDSESGVLTVSGERKHKREEEKTEDADDGKRKYHFVERSYGKTARSVRLPETADASKATAMYSAGVLTVTFPKKEARPNRRLQIPVVGGDGQGSGDGGGAPVAVRNSAEN